MLRDTNVHAPVTAPPRYADGGESHNPGAKNILAAKAYENESVCA